VVKSVPESGAVGVDPGLKEIRITFDQAMGEGRSIVGGGEAFPEMAAAPRWITSRTIIIPVALQPNHDYWLSVNNDRFRNFTNRAGEPAVPYPIQFRTGSGAGGAADRTRGDGGAKLTTKENRRAYNLLRAAIRNHYSYRDRLGIDWDELLKRNQDALVAAKSPTEFAKIAGIVLARAQDKHIWFQAADEHIPSFVRPQVPNANFELLPKLVSGWRDRGHQVASGRWEDGIGYLAIGTWGGSGESVADVALQVLAELHDAPALVIDVRGNGGGAEPLAQKVAGCFVAEPCLYAKHVYRDPDRAGGFSSVHERRLEPNRDQPHFAGRVAVLSGPVVMSSCEAFLLMMKQVPGAVLVGAPSQGSSGNPKPHDLRNGVTVFLPSWKSMLPDGAEFEGIGIAPDIEVKAAPRDFASADPVLEAALAQLRRNIAH